MRGGARIFLKREDLNHTGSHKINNVLGQALLAQRMGKNRVIAETGAGQHGVATATVCALLGLECVIYMGRVDTDRQALNVARMRLLGAEVIAVDNGSATLKDAINEAMRDWVTNAHNTYYCFGTAAGPHPFPVMVRDLQRVVGLEARAQILDKAGRLPDAVTACVGGGSNAIGIFHPPFIDDKDVRLVGFELPVRVSNPAVTQRLSPAGRRGGRSRARTHTCCRTRTVRRSNPTRSPPVSTTRASAPEHAYLKDTGRAEYRPITDTEAMDALALLSRREGIIPAIESAHAVAGSLKLGKELGEGSIIVVSLSGRGDKDVDTAARWFGLFDPPRRHRTRRRPPAGNRESRHERRHDPVENRTGVRQVPRGEPRCPDRLPPGGLSDRRRFADVLPHDGRRRLRHHRGRRALLRSGDGRSDDPGSRRSRPHQRRPRP